MFIEPKKDNGWIEVISGPMFSGKTEELIRRVKEAMTNGLSVATFKPAIDNRYHAGKITSHNGNNILAIPIERPGLIWDHYNNQNIVAVDEAQFFGPELVDVVSALADQRVRVLIAGLDMDFMARPFGSLPELLARAENITKLHAICHRCGANATYTFKLVQNEKIVEIGERDLYQALCRSCYNSAMLNDRLADPM